MVGYYTAMSMSHILRAHHLQRQRDMVTQVSTLLRVSQSFVYIFNWKLKTLSIKGQLSQMGGINSDWIHGGIPDQTQI